VGHGVIAFICRRAAGMALVLLGVSLVVFLMIKLIPGDPAAMLLGPQASPEAVRQLRTAMGLDAPLATQYLRWIGRLLHGDLGTSISLSEPVTTVILHSFSNTALLGVVALVLATASGILAGIISATHPGSPFDKAAMLAALFLNSMPSFWLGLVLILVLSLSLRLLPVGGMYSARGSMGLPDLLTHMILPTLTLGAWTVGIIARISRSTMLEVIGLPYVRTARAKGLPERGVIYKHALRNALLPVVTVVSLQAGNLLGGAVITETVFAWPGLGLLMYNAIGARDLPVILGGVLIMSAVFVVINAAVDVLYALLDPRITLA